MLLCVWVFAGVCHVCGEGAVTGRPLISCSGCPHMYCTTCVLQQQVFEVDSQLLLGSSEAPFGLCLGCQGFKPASNQQGRLEQQQQQQLGEQEAAADAAPAPAGGAAAAPASAAGGSVGAVGGDGGSQSTAEGHTPRGSRDDDDDGVTPTPPGLIIPSSLSEEQVEWEEAAAAANRAVQGCSRKRAAVGEGGSAPAGAKRQALEGQPTTTPGSGSGSGKDSPDAFPQHLQPLADLPLQQQQQGGVSPVLCWRAPATQSARYSCSLLGTRGLGEGCAPSGGQLSPEVLRVLGIMSQLQRLLLQEQLAWVADHREDVVQGVVDLLQFVPSVAVQQHLCVLLAAAQPQPQSWAQDAAHTLFCAVALLVLCLPCGEALQQEGAPLAWRGTGVGCVMHLFGRGQGWDVGACLADCKAACTAAQLTAGPPNTKAAAAAGAPVAVVAVAAAEAAAAQDFPREAEVGATTVLGYSPTDADAAKVARLWPCEWDWPALPYSTLECVVQLLRVQLALDLNAPFTVNLFEQLWVFQQQFTCQQEEVDELELAASRVALLNSMQTTSVLAAEWVPVADRAAQESAAGEAAGAELWLTSSGEVPASVLQALQQLGCQQQVRAEDFAAAEASWVKATHSACCQLLDEILAGAHSSGASDEAGGDGAQSSGGSDDGGDEPPAWQLQLGPAWPLSGAYLAAWANVRGGPEVQVQDNVDLKAWLDTSGWPLHCLVTLTSFCTDCISDSALGRPRIWQECSSGWASGGGCGALHRELHERLCSVLEPLRACVREHKQRVAAQQGEQAEGQEQQQQVGSRLMAPMCEQLLLMHMKHARLQCRAGHSNCHLQHNGCQDTQQRAAAVQLRAEGASLLDRAVQEVVGGALDLLAGNPADAAGPPSTALAAGSSQQQQQLVACITQLAAVVAAVCDLLLLEDDAELLHQASYAHPGLAAAAAAAGGGSRGARASLLQFLWKDLQLAGGHISQGQWQQAADVLEGLVTWVGRRHCPPVLDSMPPGFTQAG